MDLQFLAATGTVSGSRYLFTSGAQQLLVDCDEIMDWLRGFRAPPRRAFITHGEPAAADALRHRVEETLRWRCEVPEYLQRVRLA